MKNIEKTGFGLANLFISDLQSLDLTLKTKSPYTTTEGSGTKIMTAFSNFDDDEK